MPVPPVASLSECLSESAIAEFVEGSLVGPALARAEEHLAHCEACMGLVAAVGNAMTETAAAAVSADEVPDEPPLVHGASVGRYVILEAVGAGAMGRVYSAHDPSLDRTVALKLLHPHIKDPDLETRLLREAKAMARLSHPEVITVHDAGRHGTQLFIAMEFVDGGTLRQWAAARPRTWRQVLAVYMRAGHGLAQAHAAGIVHRDFKPDNVLVGTDVRVRVTDFGLARTVLGDDAVPVSSRRHAADLSTIDASLTRSGTLVGTPAYMAPEQLAGSPADARSDLYGFCVALYEALYGERPFAATSFATLHLEKLSGIVRAPPPGRRVPPRLRRALLLGLRPRPQDRYQTMASLLDALERASRVSRMPVVALAVGVSVLAAGGAAIGLGARAGRSRAGALSSASAVLTAPPGCTSHRACTEAHAGTPHVCRASDHTCAAVASPDCVPLFEPSDLRPDDSSDTVWLGAMFPAKGPSAEAFGKMNLDGADFARAEIARATSALAGSSAAQQVRRIALVACDDSEDPMRAAKHLVDDVGVPAILGFGSGKEIETVAGSLLINREVLTVASLTSSPLITRLPQPANLPRMVWRTTYSVDAVAEATAHFLHDVLESRATAAGARGETHVTVARVDMGAGLWFGEALYRQLVFNGKPAVDNGPSYQEITFGSAASEDEISRVVDRVVQTSPTFVVLLGATATTVAIVRGVETRWKSPAPAPTYLIAQDSTQELAPFLGKNRERRRRVFAISSVSNQTSNARFVMRFEAAHPGEATRSLNPGVSYDAFYALAYAVFALGPRPITGPELGRAFARIVPPGRPIETGPSDVFDALTTLAKGDAIDLTGSSGALDFDLATGETSSDFSLLCPNVDPGGRAVGEVDSGVVYRASARRVEGTLRCP